MRQIRAINESRRGAAVRCGVVWCGAVRCGATVKLKPKGEQNLGYVLWARIHILGTVRTQWVLMPEIEN